MLASPFSDFFSNKLIEWSAINKSVLKFSTTWIRCLNKYENTFIFFLAYIDEGLNSVRTKIRVHCYKILIKACT